MGHETASKSSPVRFSNSLLGGVEGAFIDWFTQRAPVWVTPDMLSGIGFAGALLTFCGYVLSRLSPSYLWVASAGLLINWFGDSTDGGLARYRHMERPRYGLFLDHSVDSISMVLVFLGGGLSPYVRLSVALLALSGYLLLSIFVYLNTLVTQVFQLSFSRIGPTEARALLVAGNSIALWAGRPEVTTPIGVFILYELLMIAVAAVLFFLYVVMVLRRLRCLSVEDPLPVPPSGRTNRIAGE